MKAATVNIKKAWSSNKRCSQRMEEVQNKEKDGRECIHGSNPQDKGNAHFEWQKLPPHLQPDTVMQNLSQQQAIHEQNIMEKQNQEEEKGPRD